MKNWQGENDFKLFKQSLPVSSAEIWSAFYQFHKTKIKIQNEKIAVKKLATIVNATFKLAHDKGFALMSLRDLSQETKISLGGIYAYIGSKQQLALMIHQFLPHMFTICLLDKASISVTQSDRQTIKLQLNQFIRGHIFLSECLQPWFFFAYMEAKYLSKAVKSVALENEKSTEKIIQKILQKANSKNHIQHYNSFLATMTIKALLQSWYLKRIKFTQHKIDCEDYIKHIEAIVDRGL